MAGGAESRALVGLGGEWGAVGRRGREEIIQIFKKLKEVGVEVWRIFGEQGAGVRRGAEEKGN